MVLKGNKVTKWCARLALLVFPLTVFSTTLAWYNDQNSTVAGMNSVVHGNYFEGGDGSEGDPFQIARPVQLYYLSWLQEMGYFNQEVNGSIKQYYFVLNNDIDMSNYTLPPIGTQDYPFVGNFDGKNKTVSNLTITNDQSKYTEIPSEASGVEIVGFFGVVGSLDAPQEGVDPTVPSRGPDGRPSTPYTYSSSALEVKDFYIDGCTIRTEDSADSKALIGIAAGYVNGTISGVGVSDSNLYIQSGRSAITEYTTNMSNYSIVGYCRDPYIGSKTITDQKLPREIENQTVTEYAPDDGSAWGGSIDMNELHTRLTGMRGLAAGYDDAKYVSAQKDLYSSSGELISSDKTESTMRQGGASSSARFYEDDFGGSVYFYNTNAQYLYLYGENDTNFKKTISNFRYTGDDYPAFYITDGTYALTLNNNKTGVISVPASDLTNVTKWIIDDDGYIYAVDFLNEKVYALNTSGTNLTIADNPSTTWNFEQSSKTGSVAQGKISTTLGGNTRYLACPNGTWQLVVSNMCYITDNHGNYLAYNNTTSVKNVTSQSEASQWIIDDLSSGKIYYLNGNTPYYLYANGNNLALTTTATGSGRTWYFNDHTIYTDSSHKIVCENGQWSLKSAPQPVVKNLIYATVNDTKHYLSIDPNNPTGGLIDTTNPADATSWIYSTGSNKTITTVANNGTTYGIRVTSNSLTAPELSISTNPTSLSSVGSTIYAGKYRIALIINNDYYLIYNNGWELSTSSQNISYETYQVADQSFYGDITVIPTPSKNLYLTDTSIEYIEKTTTTTERSGWSTYIPLSANPSSSGDTAYDAKPTNTGYIVSGGYSAASGSGRGDIRVSYYPISGNISSCYDTNSHKFTHVYTYNGSNVDIVNDHDNYEKFNDSRAALEDTLSKGSNCYGLHFMDASINVNHKIVAPNARINNIDYTNYELPMDSIDFSLQSKGFINFFAGTYYSGNTSFFSLHQVFRDSSNNIQNIKEISKIYEHKTDVAKPYLYRYSDGTYSDSSASLSDYNMKFDTDWITSIGSAIEDNAVYYFEVPANKGEYALGSVSGSDGAYLLYLDLSANKQIVQSTRKTIEQVTGEDEYDYAKGVAFVDNPGDAVDPLDSATYSLNGSYSTSGTNYNREGNNITVTPSTGVTANYVGEGITSSPGNPTPRKSTYTTTTTVTHSDYNTVTQSTILHRVVFTDVIVEENGVQTISRRDVLVNVYYVPDGTTTEIFLMRYSIADLPSDNGYNFEFTYNVDTHTLNESVKLKENYQITLEEITASSSYNIKIQGTAYTSAPADPISITKWKDTFTPLPVSSSSN